MQCFIIKCCHIAWEVRTKIKNIKCFQSRHTKYSKNIFRHLPGQVSVNPLAGLAASLPFNAMRTLNFVVPEPSHALSVTATDPV